MIKVLESEFEGGGGNDWSKEWIKQNLFTSRARSNSECKHEKEKIHKHTLNRNYTF